MNDDENMQAVLIRFPPELYARVRAVAAADDRTISATIRRAVREYVERHYESMPSGDAP